MAPVSKMAVRAEVCRRSREAFGSARSAFKSFLVRVGAAERGGVLLPAYIGWSPREGSGVFDPIRELGAPCEFYRMSRDLRVDVDDVRAKISRTSARVLVLIHYFGFPDPDLAELARLAREAGLIVVEDEAHAMLSDLIGGVCGRYGDAAVFSLHKLLPVRDGGLLVLNDSGWYDEGAPPDTRTGDFDLFSIAERRVANASFLLERLPSLGEHLTLLQASIPEGVVPQTLPVALTNASRDRMYERMNAAGFGVVSLYHTMIAELDPVEYPDSHWLSRRVMNLPVHQDATTEELELLLATMKALFEEGV